MSTLSLECSECGVELDFPEGKFWALRGHDLAAFCPPCLETEESAKLVKLDGFLRACGNCGAGLEPYSIGELVGCCSPSCRDEFIEKNSHQEVKP